MNDEQFRAYIEQLFDAKLETVERELKAIITAMKEAVALRAELEKTNTLTKTALWIAGVGWAVAIIVGSIVVFFKH